MMGDPNVVKAGRRGPDLASSEVATAACMIEFRHSRLETLVNKVVRVICKDRTWVRLNSW